MYSRGCVMEGFFNLLSLCVILYIVFAVFSWRLDLDIDISACAWGTLFLVVIILRVVTGIGRFIQIIEQKGSATLLDVILFIGIALLFLSLFLAISDYSSEETASLTLGVIGLVLIIGPMILKVLVCLIFTAFPYFGSSAWCLW